METNGRKHLSTSNPTVPYTVRGHAYPDTCKNYGFLPIIYSFNPMFRFLFINR